MPSPQKLPMIQLKHGVFIKITYYYRPSFFRNRNSVSMTNKLGIKISDDTRHIDSVTGQTFLATFTIFDRRDKVSHRRQYNVQVLAVNALQSSRFFQAVICYSIRTTKMQEPTLLLSAFLIESHLRQSHSV